MAEFVLNRFALQELRIVEDQQIDSPQVFLESDSGLRLQRGDKAIHELFGGEIDDAPSLSRR